MVFQMQKREKYQSSNNLDKGKKNLRDYARYSNLGFMLIAVILAAFFIGLKVDKWIPTGFPQFTLLFTVGGLALTLYLVLKDLLK